MQDPFIHPPNEAPIGAVQSSFNKRLLSTWSTLEAMYTSSSRHRHVGLVGVDSSTAAGLREAWLLRRHGPGYGPGPADLLRSTSQQSADVAPSAEPGTELTEKQTRKQSLRLATISLRPREDKNTYVAPVWGGNTLFRKVGLSSRMQLVQ
jgi:hypothetical protein